MCTKQLGYVFLGAYRVSGILPARRYTKRFRKTHELDHSNNLSGKLVRELRIRESASVRLLCGECSVLVRRVRISTQYAGYALRAYANPSAYALCAMRRVRFLVRATKKEIGTHKECQRYGNLLFVGRTRRMTQDTAKAVCDPMAHEENVKEKPCV